MLKYVFKKSYEDSGLVLKSLLENDKKTFKSQMQDHSKYVSEEWGVSEVAVDEEGEIEIKDDAKSVT